MMEPTKSQFSLPSSDCSNLHLAHPTEEENVYIWTNTFKSWGDYLDLPGYIRESQYLTTVPLATNGGMTTWILVDKTLPPNGRPILCSCESFYKRSLTSNAGKVDEVVVHGIASVFCPETLRRRGYTGRLMRELAKVLRAWQSDSYPVAGSVLYSDIGKIYYTKLGWMPNATNAHIEFLPVRGPKPPLVRDILQSELPELCERDEAMIRSALVTLTPGIRRLVIVPDLDHMLWHIAKEDFATEYLYKKLATVKGAIAGPPGKQVWAVWTHRYYGRHDSKPSHNTLYILRLVVEGDRSAYGSSSEPEPKSLSNDQISYLEVVLRAAQAEAADWHLDRVELWEPSPRVEEVIASGIISHTVVERTDDSIASGMWYDDGNVGMPPTWIHNEHYAWC
ncbi:hypothetical protein F4808DRAFT_320979 [Astrocystis sublimbata]|nr:hypothetical protein F4808DRAFT_320979 [Astrocystis sublimbata]